MGGLATIDGVTRRRLTSGRSRPKRRADRWTKHTTWRTQAMPDDRLELQTIQVKPLTPTIGAELFGVDLSQPLSEAQFGEIHAALMRHLVIFFRDQHLTIEQHKAFGRRFGELDIHPTSRMEGHPEIIEIKADA